MRPHARMHPKLLHLKCYAAPRPGLGVAVRLLPMIFFVAYLSLTVVLFACGPWPWPSVNRTALYVFLTFAHLALITGYLSATFERPGGYYGRMPVRTLLRLSLLVNLAMVA